MSPKKHLKKSNNLELGVSVVLPTVQKASAKNAIEVELPKAKVVEVALPKAGSKKKRENPHSGNASFTVVDVPAVAPEVPKKLRKLSVSSFKKSTKNATDQNAPSKDDANAKVTGPDTNSKDDTKAKAANTRSKINTDAALKTKSESKATKANSQKSSKRRRFSFGLPKGSTPKNYSNRLTLPELINAESAIGRTLFGPIPMGHQREFFTSRRNVWIWHESWTDQLGRVQKYTVRYEVRPEGVFKRAGRSPYERIEGEELDNFRATAKTYLNLVKRNLYS